MSRDFSGGAALLQYLGTQGVSAYPLTIAAWIYTTTNDNDQRIFEVIGSPTTSFIRLYLTTTVVRGQVSFEGSGAFASGASYSLNTWLHVVFVLTSATHRIIYVNGSAGTANTINVSFPAGLDNLRIGASVDGLVAELGMWEVALSATEIGVLADGFSPLAIRPDMLLSYYPITGAHDPEMDIIRGNSATLVSSPTAAAHPRISKPHSVYVPSGVVTAPPIVPAYRRRIIFAI